MPSFVDRIIEEPRDPIGGASGGKRYYSVRYLGKTNNEEFPYTVANEFVATQIGLALGLHLPNVLIHLDGSEAVILVQMQNRADSMLSIPATSAALAEYVQQHPWEVHGAIVFDLFVGNNDRAFGPERRNLFLTPDEQLLLIDNGNACFYRPREGAKIEAGIPRLIAIERNLRALDDMRHKGNHYFQLLQRSDLVAAWCQRIAALPDFLIEGFVARLPNDLPHPTVEERKVLMEFLLKRRGYLFEHIMQVAPEMFPRLDTGGRQ